MAEAGEVTGCIPSQAVRKALTIRLQPLVALVRRIQEAEEAAGEVVSVEATGLGLTAGTAVPESCS